jgi:hypothetical protein
MTSLAIIQLTDEEQAWLGADVRFVIDGITGANARGQVVALAPKPGHVWICDGETFQEVRINHLRREFEQEALL